MNRSTGAPKRGRWLGYWTAVGATWSVFVAVVLVVAGVVAVADPNWLGGSTRRLPDRPLLIVDILVNNLLIALLPLFGGWLAAGYLLAGHRLLARVFVLLPTLIVGRSLVTIGAVGGADPAWLADAARWWLLELLALAVSWQSGCWLARHPDQREEQGRLAARRTVAIIVTSLSLAAVVEVLTA